MANGDYSAGEHTKSAWDNLGSDEFYSRSWSSDWGVSLPTGNDIPDISEIPDEVWNTVVGDNIENAANYLNNSEMYVLDLKEEFANIFLDGEQYDELAGAVISSSEQYLIEKLERLRKLWTESTEVSVKSLLDDSTALCVDVFSEGGLNRSLQKLVGFISYLTDIDFNSMFDEDGNADLWKAADSLGTDFFSSITNNEAIQKSLSGLSIIQGLGSIVNVLSETEKFIENTLSTIEPIIPILEIVYDLISSQYTQASNNSNLLWTELWQRLLALVMKHLKNYLFNITFTVPMFLVEGLSSISRTGNRNGYKGFESAVASLDWNGWQDALLGNVHDIRLNEDGTVNRDSVIGYDQASTQNNPIRNGFNNTKNEIGNLRNYADFSQIRSRYGTANTLLGAVSDAINASARKEAEIVDLGADAWEVYNASLRIKRKKGYGGLLDTENDDEANAIADVLKNNDYSGVDIRHLSVNDIQAISKETTVRDAIKSTREKNQGFRIISEISNGGLDGKSLFIYNLTFNKNIYIKTEENAQEGEESTGHRVDLSINILYDGEYSDYDYLPLSSDEENIDIHISASFSTKDLDTDTIEKIKIEFKKIYEDKDISNIEETKSQDTVCFEFTAKSVLSTSITSNIKVKESDIKNAILNYSESTDYDYITVKRNKEGITNVHGNLLVKKYDCTYLFYSIK